MSFATGGMGATFQGPAGVLVSLGIEYITANPLVINQLYNYAALIPLFILAITASQRDARFVGLLLPIWAGFALFFGWLKYPDINGIAGTGDANAFALIIILLMLGIMTYMHETVHERFGIAGPGNKIIKIFTFLIVLQCVVVFFNSAAIFPALFPPGVQPIAAGNSQQFGNIDLTSQMTSVSGSGGLWAQIVDIATITLQLAVSSLFMFLKFVIGIAAFSIILASIFPWITMAGAAGVAFLVVIQFAIWTMYAIFIFTVFYKPGPDPGW